MLTMNSMLLNNLHMNRRSALSALGALSVGLASGGSANAAPSSATPLPTGKLNYNDPKDNLLAFAKIWSSLDEPVIGGFHGIMYLRTGSKRMIPLFGYEGTGVLQARWEADGTLSRRSRETGYFTDLRTGEVLERWDNPFTGQTVPVYHFYNPLLVRRMDYQMSSFSFGKSSDAPTLMNEGTVFPDDTGKIPFVLPFQQYGDDLMLNWDYTHEYTNPVTPEGWPKSSTGPRISPSEHFTFSLSKTQLEDPGVASARFIAGFSRISQCWPWMQMGGSGMEDAQLVGRMFSHKGLPGTADVRPKILAYIEKHAPEYLTLPDSWEMESFRIDTWSTYAADVPPENPDYDWVEKRPKHIAGPPTGSGAAG
jgi:hypothetical protein